MKKVLVTGGAGFIGSHVVDHLVNKGYHVAVVDNLSTGKMKYVNEKATFYNLDITQDVEPAFVAEKPDFVIHTAAQVMLRKSLEDPIFDARTNILGSLNVLEACRKHHVKRVVYTSTGGARVGEPEYLPVDEKHPLNPCSPYGISKHTVEHYVWMYHELYGLDYLVYCFGNVYGPRDDPACGRLTSVFIEKMINGETPIIFGDGNQTRDFIYVLDLAEFIVDSLEKNPKNKLFHLANGNEVTVNQIFDILKEISDFGGDVKHIDSIKGEVRNIVLDTTLARNELGWDPKHGIKQGLKETYEWFKENYKKDNLL